MKKIVFTVLLIMFLISTAGVFGNISPDQDLSAFPPWVWPYIRTAAILDMVQNQSIVVKDSNPIPAKEMEIFSKGIATAAMNQFIMVYEAGNRDFGKVLEITNRMLVQQYQQAAMQFETLGMVTYGKSKSLLTLFKVQLDACRSIFFRYFKLTDSDQKALDSLLANQQELYANMVKRNSY